MRLLTMHMRWCDVCAMIRKRVACAIAAAVLFKVNDSTQQKYFQLTTWHYHYIFFEQ